jgi:uncharacterized membrane protein
MKPLIVLLVSFVIALLGVWMVTREFDPREAGNIAMSAMLFFTAIGHFAYTKGMTMMMPAPIPFKKQLVYLTGVIEIVFALFLPVPRFSACTGWLLIVFFIVLLPANIFAALHQVDYQKGNFEGSGRRYLWFRVPLQAFFIAWVYLSAIRVT